MKVQTVPKIEQKVKGFFSKYFISMTYLKGIAKVLVLSINK
jgi:hypothetical protein